MYCDDCNCIGCSNTPENKEIVKNAISATLSRNPKAFSDKIKYQDAVIFNFLYYILFNYFNIYPPFFFFFFF